MKCHCLFGCFCFPLQLKRKNMKGYASRIAYETFYNM